MSKIAIISITVILSVTVGGAFTLAAYEDHLQEQCRAAYAGSTRAVAEIQAICGN